MPKKAAYFAGDLDGERLRPRETGAVPLREFGIHHRPHLLPWSVVDHQSVRGADLATESKHSRVILAAEITRQWKVYETQIMGNAAGYTGALGLAAEAIPNELLSCSASW